MPCRPILLAALAIAFASPLKAQETRNEATLLSMVAGDVACHLTLRDAAGQRFSALAEFGICEQKALLNKRVRLTYRQSRVLADECQGNPECRKSKTVMLVVAAQPVSAATETFCLAAEAVVFNCAVGEKTVSVCSSQNASRAAGYLKYRFGKPASGSPEIALPDAERQPPRAASGAVVSFSGGGGVWLRFVKAPFAYVVYTGIGNWGPRGAKKEIAGVSIERDGRPIANVKCTGRPKSELSPAWFEQMGIKDDGREFEFPTSD